MATNGRLSPRNFPSTSKSDLKPANDMKSSNSEVNNHEKYNESFEYVHTSCYLCNGYYGPNFDEPVCITCHTFLFPEDLSHCLSGHAFVSEKVDDGDSGNDEPTDLNYCADRRPSENQPIRSLAQKPQPIPMAVSRPDLLNIRLEMLSNPREPDDLSSGVVDRLPPEVLLAVFSYLDDISLWCAGKVCKRWSHLLRDHVPNEQWRQYTVQRWPLFKPICDIQDWYDVYSDLTDSCPCKACLQQMAMRMQPPGEENSWRRHRLRNELKYMRSDPPEGIEATPLDPKCCHWQATITGPVGSPYEGGLFYLYVQVPYSYPMCPPIVRFLTRIFHPNVSRHGDVGIDSIQHNWSLALTISKVLISVQSLLTDPFCQACMEPQLGDLYLNNRTAFEDVARAWTWRYAMHDVVRTPAAVSFSAEEGTNLEERSQC